MEELMLNTLMAKPKRTSEGKKKIDVTKKVMKKTSRQVMFSKRRKGLFKKCDELCSSYGAQIGLITVSEAGNLFTYGNPNLDYIVERCLNSGSTVVSNTNNGVNYGENCGGFWWDGVDIEKLGLIELEGLKAELERVKNEVVSGIDSSLGTSRNEVIVSGVDDFILDFSTSDHGIGFDDFKFDCNIGGNFNDIFGSDFDFNFNFW